MIYEMRSRVVSSSNASAQLLRDWLDRATFTWIVSEEILDEYKAVLRRLKVRRETIGILINLLREEAELIAPRRPIRQTILSVPALRRAARTSW